MFFPQKAFGFSSQDVIFLEVMWMGSSSSSADEWIELYNTTNENIDLTGWQITNLKNGQESLMLEISSGIIPKNGYFLIANGSKDKSYTGGQSILNISPDLENTAISLSNTNFQLKLYHGQWSHGVSSIDVAGDGHLPPAGDNVRKISMQRLSPVNTGDLTESWINTTTKENLDSQCTDVANPHNSGKPNITNFLISEKKLFLSYKEKKGIFFSAEVSDDEYDLDLETVVLDLSNLGIKDLVKLYDDGSHGDLVTSDNIFSLNYEFILRNPKDEIGYKEIAVKAKDKNGFINSQKIELTIYQLSDQVVINEFYPHPTNGTKDEFIELYNRGNYPVNLYNWSLDDQITGGSNSWKINNILTIIEPKNYITFYNPEIKISLNDNGDSVSLFSSNGEHLNRVDYEKALEGQSYNYDNYLWQWSMEPTANIPNVIKLETPKANIVSQSSKTTTSQSIINKTMNNKISNKQSDTTISVTNNPFQNNPSLNSLNDIINNINSDNDKLDNLSNWIKINQYVIIFANVICIFWLGYYLWKPTHY